MTGNLIRLAELAERTTTLAIACSRCDRRGQLSVAKLLAKHGPSKALTKLLYELVADCPKAGGRVYDRCDPFYPELAELFAAP